MIELKASGGHEIDLVVDGVSYTDVVDVSSLQHGRYDVRILDNDLIEKLIRHRISDFPWEISRLVLYTNLRLIKGVQEISQGITVFRDPVGRPCIGFIFLFSPENWKKLWSISEYQLEFRQVYEREDIPRSFWSGREAIPWVGAISPMNPIAVSFTVNDERKTIEEETREHSAIITHLHKYTEASLLAKLQQESVVMHFNFPQEVAVSCEQYLAYFVHFLKDLGVDASHELKHKAGQVLFTVTPASEEDALDKIRAALEIYLRLPASPVSNDMNNDIAIQRLESQVLRFQSDLKLAVAELQAKNATIEAQQITITIQKALLNGEILLNSMKDVTPKEKVEDREEFFDGTLALSVYKDKGVEVNWAKMFRQLKELFSKKGDK